MEAFVLHRFLLDLSLSGLLHVWNALHCAGDASLMITFNPIITALLAIPFLGEKMTKRLGAGLIIALSGVAILFVYSPNVDIPVDERILGNILIISQQEHGHRQPSS